SLSGFVPARKSHTGKEKHPKHRRCCNTSHGSPQPKLEPSAATVRFGRRREKAAAAVRVRSGKRGRRSPGRGVLRGVQRPERALRHCKISTRRAQRLPPTAALRGLP